MKPPLTLLTGFLGSGKSTLLSQILTDPSFSNCAVIVNEFGEVGLDDFLVRPAEEQIVQMTTGCLCCTIRGDISETLFELWTQRKTGDVPPFERVIIETTGLADPAPVLQTLMNDPRLFSRFHLSGVITTLDVLNGQATLDQQEECVKQVAVADRIVITKTDLDLQSGLLEKLSNRVRHINPMARLIIKHGPDFTLESLFDTTLFDEKTKTADVQKWLNLDQGHEDPPHNHDHDHHQHTHHHDVNKHGDQIETFSIILDAPLPTQPFIQAIQSLVLRHGRDLLRLKGVANLQERPQKPYVFHGVQHIFHEPIELSSWPTQDQRTKMVFITRNLARADIEIYFKAWLKP